MCKTVIKKVKLKCGDKLSKVDPIFYPIVQINLA